MSDSLIPNVLAERYASEKMRAIWSPQGKVRLERELWIAVMKAQRDLGLDIPPNAIEAYEKVIDHIDLASITRRERETRHDVKARIDEFCALAGHEHIHKGMTSRDLTENVEQLQTYRALQLIRTEAYAAALALAQRAEQDAALPMTARTHNVAAQLTTVGKRWAMFAEELLGAVQSLENLIDHYPVRGLKGAVGTQLDQLSLFAGDATKVAALEEALVKHLGMPQVFIAVGQVYPRSLDFRVVSTLCDIASAPGNFAKTLRLMAGYELASEGFAKGQTGSSAMPHKMNSRSCERINGFHSLLKGHVAMISHLSGDQWNEGDVSCSVVRRVVLPDAFFALDGLFETFLTVLQQMDVYAASIDRENRRYLPFLLSTTFMMAAVKAGVGRETAHEVIKEHAVAVATGLRSGELVENTLIERLAADQRLNLSRAELEAAFQHGQNETGAALTQIKTVVERIRTASAACPQAATHRPGVIL